MEKSQIAVANETSASAEFEIVSITADQIIAAHKEAVDLTWALLDAGNKWIIKAAACGRLLIAKKAELGHGNWMPWLAENIKEFGIDTAQDYMKAARYSDKNPNLEGKELNSTWVQNLRQAAGILEDKPSSDQKEREKPPFVIRCVFNIEPEKLDEVQRRTAFDEAKPLLEAFQMFGLIEIKA